MIGLCMSWMLDKECTSRRSLIVPGFVFDKNNNSDINDYICGVCSSI